MTKLLNSPGTHGFSLGPIGLRFLAASALALSLTGCAHRSEEGRVVGSTEPVMTYQERHPIEIEKARANLALSVPAGVAGLNSYQGERVRHFVGLWRNEGAGKIVVSGNNRGALADVRDILIEHGVPVGAVQVVGYDQNQPGVKLSFARYVAEGPKCGEWPSNVAEDKQNTNYENFGCAQQHNMAAMIANPRDLVVPRDQTDWSDSDRRDFVFRAWRSGDKTAADTRDVTQNGNISDVAKK